MNNNLLDGCNFDASLNFIKEKLHKYNNVVVDQLEGKSFKAIGLVKNKYGQIGALLDKDIYQLRAVDASYNPPRLTSAIGRVMVDNNIENFNLDSIYEFRTIVEIIKFE